MCSAVRMIRCTAAGRTTSRLGWRRITAEKVQNTRADADPVTLAYSEMFDTQSEAMQREAAIKRLTRPQKQALIDSQNGGELLTVYDADGRACGERPRAVVHAQGCSPCVPPVGGR